MEKFITGILMIVAGILIEGFFVMKLWTWFIVPPFGVPILTYAHSIGIMMFITLVLKSIPKGENKPISELITDWLSGLIIMIILFIIAWITFLAIS